MLRIQLLLSVGVLFVDNTHSRHRFCEVLTWFDGLVGLVVFVCCPVEKNT